MNAFFLHRLRRVALASMGLILVCGAISIVPYRLLHDPVDKSCLPWSWYLLHVADDSLPVRGELVTYRAKGMSPYFEDGVMITKMVLGIPGDVVEVTNTNIIGPNQKVCCLNPAILKKLGLKSSDVIRSYRLKPNEYFLVGTSLNAYDSRYIGPIQGTQIAGVTKALW